MNDASQELDPFEIAAELFLVRFRAGERPSIDEYASRYPELAGQIRELLPALVMVEQHMSSDVSQRHTDIAPPFAVDRDADVTFHAMQFIDELARLRDHRP